MELFRNFTPEHLITFFSRPVNLLIGFIARIDLSAHRSVSYGHRTHSDNVISFGAKMVVTWPSIPRSDRCAVSRLLPIINTKLFSAARKNNATQKIARLQGPTKGKERGTKKIGTGNRKKLISSPNLGLWA